MLSCVGQPTTSKYLLTNGALVKRLSLSPEKNVSTAKHESLVFPGHENDNGSIWRDDFFSLNLISFGCKNLALYFSEKNIVLDR